MPLIIGSTLSCDNDNVFSSLFHIVIYDHQILLSVESMDHKMVASILRGLADAADNWQHTEL